MTENNHEQNRDSEEGQNPNLWETKMTRREFLKTAAIGLAATTIGRKFSDKSYRSEYNELSEIHKPEIQNNIEVYGLGESLKTEGEVALLYESLDQRFLRKNGILLYQQPLRKREIRAEYLDPQTRHLEVVVTEKTYREFLRRRGETGVDFTTWVKDHVDCLNIILENAKPPTPMRASLERIIIISNELANRIYNPRDKDKLGHSFDAKWKERWGHTDGLLPLDIDTSWGIAEDYRPKGIGTTKGYFWKYNTTGKEIVFSSGDRRFTYPYIGGYPNMIRSGQIDMGMIHEWSHYLLGLPDEYSQNFGPEDVWNTGEVFTNFLMGNGNFVEPRISPFLVALLNNHIKNRRRTSLRDEIYGIAYNYWDIPKGLKIQLPINDGGWVMKYGIIGDFNSPGIEQSQSNNGEIIIPSTLGSARPRDMNHLTITEKSPAARGEKREIHMPYSVFNLMALMGIEGTSLRVQFLKGSFEQSGQKTQIAEIVHDSELARLLKERSSKGLKPYASMQISGTGSWVVWFIS